jgi:predicted RNA-binding protein with PIN domain
VGREILVDGYNVIKRDPAFHALHMKNLGAARDALVRQLISKYRHTPHHVTVVFDGDGPREQTIHEQRVRIIFSVRGQTADCVISRLAAQARAQGKEVELYSDDLEVQHAIKKEGGNAYTTGQLTSHLNEPPHYLKRQVRYRQFARQKYGLNPTSGKDDDLYRDISYSHKKKRRKR